MNRELVGFIGKRDGAGRSFCKEPTRMTCTAPNCDCRETLHARYRDDTPDDPCDGWALPCQ